MRGKILGVFRLEKYFNVTCGVKYLQRLDADDLRGVLHVRDVVRHLCAPRPRCEYLGARGTHECKGMGGTKSVHSLQPLMYIRPLKSS